MSVADFVALSRARIVAWWRSRVVWVLDSPVSLAGELSVGKKWVVVLGREHYEERVKFYSVRSWAGLRSVLRLEFANDQSTLFVIGEMSLEGREVHLYRLKPSGLEAIKEAVVAVPESFLLDREVSEREVLHFIRDSVEYYLARGCASQLRGGAILSPRLFALSAGMPEESPIREIDVTAAAEIIERRLLRIPFGAFWNFFVARRRWKSQVPWKEIAVTATAASLIYLGLASLYLEGASFWADRQLQALGGDVGQLIQKKQDIDRDGDRINGMAQLADSRVPTHRLWQVLAEVWKAGAVVRSVQIDERLVTILGNAQDATRVLSAVAALPQVNGVRFSAPVRSDMGNESFTIEVTLATEKKRK